MKTAGAILSALFDEQFVSKAKEYSRLHNSWEEVTARNGIAAAAAHSRIKELSKGVLLVEMDHPGWKQIIQTKQSRLLDDYRRCFPDLDISGISLLLGASATVVPETDAPDVNTPQQQHPEQDTTANNGLQTSPEKPAAVVLTGYDAIKDEAFREKLIKIGQSIAEAEQEKKVKPLPLCDVRL